ncbi:hypothetical protein SO802_021533 [Lithocarpus litseifolius]|uniref:Uncharacterized protein n=1 Tax=Lithocarpus litseifolius TaxID=425828 RepID=A0AAW2CH40_9ROSI
MCTKTTLPKHVNELRGVEEGCRKVDYVFYFRPLTIHSSIGCHEEYVNVATKKWDIAGDFWNESDIRRGVGILENPTLTLDEPELEAMVIGNASTSVTTSQSEVQSEAIDLDNEDDGCI